MKEEIDAFSKVDKALREKEESKKQWKFCPLIRERCLRERCEWWTGTQCAVALLKEPKQ